MFTSRLRLRRLRPGDAPWVAALLADPDVMRFVAPTSHADDAGRLAAALIEGDERDGPLGHGAVEDRAAGEIHGWASLKRLESGDEIEVGFRLRRASWGRGIAAEAGGRLLAHGFHDLGLPRIVGVARPENVASVRVLQKIGLAYKRTLVFDGVAWDNFAVSRDVWEKCAPRLDGDCAAR